MGSGITMISSKNSELIFNLEEYFIMFILFSLLQKEYKFIVKNFKNIDTQKI